MDRLTISNMLRDDTYAHVPVPPGMAAAVEAVRRQSRHVGRPEGRLHRAAKQRNALALFKVRQEEIGGGENRGGGSDTGGMGKRRCNRVRRERV